VQTLKTIFLSVWSALDTVAKVTLIGPALLRDIVIGVALGALGAAALGALLFGVLLPDALSRAEEAALVPSVLLVGAVAGVLLGVLMWRRRR